MALGVRNGARARARVRMRVGARLVVVGGPHEADPVLGGDDDKDVEEGDEKVIEVEGLPVGVDAALAPDAWLGVGVG